MDEPVSDGLDSSTLYDFVSGNRLGMDVRDKFDLEHLINSSESRKFFTKLLRKSLTRLNPRDAEILSLRFGLYGTKPETLEQIGLRYGLTRERIRQMEERGKRKLKSLFQEAGLEPSDL